MRSRANFEKIAQFEKKLSKVNSQQKYDTSTPKNVSDENKVSNRRRLDATKIINSLENNTTNLIESRKGSNI